jgi:hypothetical protein
LRQSTSKYPWRNRWLKKKVVRGVRKIPEVLRLYKENYSISAQAIACAFRNSPTTVREYLDRALAVGITWLLPADGKLRHGITIMGAVIS